ncbi:MAG: hypothetical protein DRJ07_03350 [Bacteroidetes bacterium]|nr:MAG: hypothetical protein DRJ07_03350 [Bacteroidota bacterium]
MADIIQFDGKTRLDIPADTILEKAIGKLDKVIIAGVDKDGAEYFASSMADGGDCLWYLERCKRVLLRKGDEEEELI